MKKCKFCKNLYFYLSILISCLLLAAIILWGYFESLQMEQPNDGWILLVVLLGLLLVAGLLGLCCIFHTVEMDGNGIWVKFLNKIIRHVSWNQVTDLYATTVMKNLAYTLRVYHQKDLHLDRREKIKIAILSYCPHVNVHPEVK